MFSFSFARHQLSVLTPWVEISALHARDVMGPRLPAGCCMFCSLAAAAEPKRLCARKDRQEGDEEDKGC